MVVAAEATGNDGEVAGFRWCAGRSIGEEPRTTKIYNMKVVDNGEIDLIDKENFKWTIEYDKFDKIILKMLRSSVQN